MPSQVFELFRTAIQNRQQVVCDYGGHHRLLCPHAVGWKDGQEKVISFQFAGGSSRWMPPTGEWRCFFLSKVSGAMVKNGPWHTGESHSRPNSCIDRTDTVVDY